jgi:filamentous hemagglutinin family protein
MKSNRGANRPNRSGRQIAFAVIAIFLGGSISISVHAQSPTGGVVTSGSATIGQSGAVTNINQSTNKASINWNSFSIGSGNTVNFNQPSTTSVTLNRVVGMDKSVIEGVLNANGQVFLVNANGILMTKGSVVNTGGFVASTLNLTDADFNAGNYTFKSTGVSGSVVNQGAITASKGGYVALMGNYVSNQGVITATLGTAVLASGDQITLNFNGDSLLSVTVDKGTLDALVENKRAIYADGGTVILTAKAADDLLTAQVKNTGIIQAQTIGDLTGKIKLLVDGGTTTVDGTLNASAPNGGDGGQIETSGDTVKVADTARITTEAASGATGMWLLDPDSFTIAASGGDITGAALSTELATTNVTLTTTKPSSSTGTDGNMNVNDAVSWSAATSLELDATNNVNVNKSITASGDGASLKLAATNGSVNVNAPITMSGSNDTLTMNANTTSGYVNINNAITMSGATNDAVVINAKDYTVLTAASYSGTTSDGSTAKTDTSGGTYGSLSFTTSNGSSSGDTLTINGDNYTLLYTMTDLINAGYTSTAFTALKKSYTGACASGSGYCMWDVATQAYDIPSYKNKGTCTSGSGTCIWNPTTQAYDIYVDTKYISGSTYYYDEATGEYDIPQLITTNQNEYGSTKYWDPYTKAYDLTVMFTSSSYYWYLDTATGKYDTLDRPALAYGGYYFYDTATGKYDLTSLAGVNYYALATDINASGTVYTSSPISYFSGTLAGLGNTINNLSINNTSTSTNVTGLISYSIGSTFRDLGLVNANIYSTNAQAEGSLVGKDWEGTYSNDYVIDGSVVSNYSTSGFSSPGTYGYGSLIGYGYGTQISNSFSNSTVAELSTSTSYAFAGGLVGYLESGSITESDSSSTVTGGSGNYFGGLVGEINNSSVTYSYATGDVLGGAYVGGLIGYVFNNDVVDYDFATGMVTATNGNVGGLIGASQSYQLLFSTSVNNTIEISHDYATGDVTGANAGGLVGLNGTTGNGPSSETISDSYATGDVTGFSTVGGLVGANNGVIDNSYATGTVEITSSGSAGSLAGSNSNVTGLIEDSYATGDVVFNGTLASGKSISIGSIVGSNSQGATLTSSYATGNIIVNGNTSAGTVNIGIISDYNQGYLSNLWSTSKVLVNGVDQTSSTAAVQTTYNGVSGQRGSYTGYSDELYFTAPEYRETMEQIGTLQANAQSGIASELSEQDDDDETSHGGVKSRGAKSAQRATSPHSRFTQPSLLEGSINYSDSSTYGAHVRAIESEGVEFNLENKKNSVQCDDKNKKK